MENIELNPKDSKIMSDLASSNQWLDSKITYVLICSEVERYIALSIDRVKRGPNGEARLAILLHTDNDGKEWERIHLRLAIISRLTSVCTWPPEWISKIEKNENKLFIQWLDPWVPFERIGAPFDFLNESLWEARKITKSKFGRVRKIRKLDYDSGKDLPLHG